PAAIGARPRPIRGAYGAYASRAIRSTDAASPETAGRISTCGNMESAVSLHRDPAIRRVAKRLHRRHRLVASIGDHATMEISRLSVVALALLVSACETRGGGAPGRVAPPVSSPLSAGAGRQQPGLPACRAPD